MGIVQVNGEKTIHVDPDTIKERVQTAGRPLTLRVLRIHAEGLPKGVQAPERPWTGYESNKYENKELKSPRPATNEMGDWQRCAGEVPEMPRPIEVDGHSNLGVISQLEEQKEQLSRFEGVQDELAYLRTEKDRLNQELSVRFQHGDFKRERDQALER